MRVTTNPTFDIETWTLESHDGQREYSGPVALCKGEGTSKDQLDKQNALQQDAYNRMKGQQDKVSGAVSQYLNGNVGFDPQQLALLKSQFLNSNAQNYQTAGQNVRTALLRSGSADGSTPVGGDYTRGVAGLEGSLASSTSSGLAGIDLQNLSQALTNKFNAASLINGQAAQMASPIGTFGSGANNALNQYVYASNNGLFSQFVKSLGGGLGQGLSAGITGGFGSALSGMKPGGGGGGGGNVNSPSGIGVGGDSTGWYD